MKFCSPIHKVFLLVITIRVLFNFFQFHLLFKMIYNCVLFLYQVEEGWWQGRRAGRVGVFPSNFVVMLDPPHTAPQPAPPVEPAPTLPPKPGQSRCLTCSSYIDSLLNVGFKIKHVFSLNASIDGDWALLLMR